MLVIAHYFKEMLFENSHAHHQLPMLFYVCRIFFVSFWTIGSLLHPQFSVVLHFLCRFGTHLQAESVLKYAWNERRIRTKGSVRNCIIRRAQMSLQKDERVRVMVWTVVFIAGCKLGSSWEIMSKIKVLHFLLVGHLWLYNGRGQMKANQGCQIYSKM